jgi:hypothetical protein
VYASRIEAGTTLEALFLELTGSTPDVGATVPAPPAPGAMPGWPT